MRISDERGKNELIEPYETQNGEVYEFSVPAYSEKPFIGMVMIDDSFDLNPEGGTLLIIDLENGYGISVEDTSEIDYVKRVEAKLILTRLTV